MEKQHRYAKLILNGKEINGPFDCQISDEAIRLTKVKEEDFTKYFFKMDAKKKFVVENWLFGEIGSNEKEKDFLAHALIALAKVKEDYFISTLEPSITANKELKFKVGEEPAIGISKREWMKLAKDYDPDHGSRLATYFELILWYCYRAAANGIHIRTLLKNYRIEDKLSKTGAKNVLGFSDGVTNTAKVVTLTCKPIMVGKTYNGAGTISETETESELKFSTGVIVLSSID